MRILTSHESPISILDESRYYNDYEYALVHLFDKHPEYYDFFAKSLAVDREVLLDNSIFELKKAFDAQAFAGWVDKLNPTCYIVPDSLQNKQETIDNYAAWMKEYSKLPGRRIGVVQGATIEEMVECYKFMCDWADQIAISFDLAAYNEIGEVFNKGRVVDERTKQLQIWCTGRQRFIAGLMVEGIWDMKKPIHLLGCSLAQEFKFYTTHDINNIRSCDTSNPVVAGILGYTYDKEFGLWHKPSQMLAEMITHKVTDDEMERINYNVEYFRTNLIK